MRILYISTSDLDDFTFGGAQRSNYIRRALLTIADVDTIVVAQADRSHVEAGWKSGRVQKISIAYDAGTLELAKHRLIARAMIARAEAEHAYDFIVARYFHTAILVPMRTHGKLVIDADDFRRDGSALSLWKKLLVCLRILVARFLRKRSCHVWLVDPRDRELLGSANCSVLPNSAKVVSTGPGPCGSAKIILMVGLYAHPPNRQGLTWFAREVFPHLRARFPGVKLHAVGRYYHKELESLGAGIEMRGYVDDLGREYGEATLVVCPVFSGSGTQIKVVEAVINAKPTVVSNFAYQGFSDTLQAGDHLLVARDPEDWITHASAILEKPDRFREMALRGQQAALGIYGMDAFRQRVVSTFMNEQAGAGSSPGTCFASSRMSAS